jgi:hypothetical protein
LRFNAKLKFRLDRRGNYAVLRIRDVYSGSRIRIFSIPDPGSEFFHDPGCSSRIRILTFYPSRIPIQGSKRHRIPDPEHCNYAEACGTDLRREGPLEGVAGLGRPAARVNIRTVVVHPLVQLLAEPVVVQLDLPALSHTHTDSNTGKNGKKTMKRQQKSYLSEKQTSVPIYGKT